LIIKIPLLYYNNKKPPVFGSKAKIKVFYFFDFYKEIITFSLQKNKIIKIILKNS